MWVFTIAVISGLALTFHERAIEITFGKYATLKAAAAQATTDAGEIAIIRQRVEAQAATMDLVAKESSDAKRLLGELRSENKDAENKLGQFDEKLKQINERTADIVRLPDGRYKMAGGIISGTPSIAADHYVAAVMANATNDFELAYKEVQTAISEHEESDKLIPASHMSNAGSFTTSGLAGMYNLGAQLAERFNDREKELDWARKADNVLTSPEAKFLLVVALIRNSKADEARQLIEQVVAKKDDSADKFKALLKNSGFGFALEDKPQN